MKSPKISAVDLPALFSRKIPFVFTLKNILAVSFFLGALQVFITIFLEPHNTGAYQVSYRNLKLSGFILCFIFPFLIFYSAEKWIYRLNDGTWRVYYELISKTLLGIAIATASYFYNITIINSISPSFERWAEHMLVFALPYIPIFVPFMIIIYVILFRFHSVAEHKITIRGQNQDDILKIKESQFVYAESDQNYVTIFFRNGKVINKKLMRSSMKAIEDQIDDSVRVHRSYLINPAYLKNIEGNKRKRFAILRFVDEKLPVSVNFGDDSKLMDSN